jgi:hypothetical protein
MRPYIGTLLITAALAGSSAACVGRVRIYDSPRQDYHRWNRGEERFYHAYLAERRRPYVEFGRLNQHEQEEYWEWRHAHPDRDPGRR